MPRLPIKLSLFFLLLLLTLGISCYFYFTPTTITLASNEETLVEESMTGVQATRFDKDGHLNQKIAMSSWQHLKGESITTMQKPELKMFYPNGSVCEISADKGEAFQANTKGPLEKLHLFQNVVVQQIGQSPDSWWELKTNTLIYFPSNETAMTDDPVTVVGPSMSVKSQGLRAYLNQQRVEFINKVTSYYAKTS